MLDNIERIKGKSYFVYSKRMYEVTNIFINTSGKLNLKRVNKYLSDFPSECIIWKSDDNRKVVLCLKKDMGKEYTPKTPNKTPWVPK